MRTLEIETPRVFMPLLADEDATGHRSRYLGVYGGRGSGKSHFFAELMIERSLVDKIDAVCVRENQKSLDQSVKKLLELKIETMNAGAYFEVQDKKIYSTLGGLIIFQGMASHTAESIKSLEGYDIAWVEEAQTLSQRSIDMLRPTIRKPGSQIWFSWNPQKESDPVDVLMRCEHPPPGTIIVQANYRDNPKLPQVLRDELTYDQKRDPDKFAHVWLGEYQRNSEARVFRNWTIEEFERPAGTVFRLGADWGFSVDPSVLTRVSLDERRLYIDYEAYMIGCEIDQLPDLFDRVPESRKWFITADSSRPETISYMQRHGYPKINRAIKGAGSIEDGIEFLKTFDIVVHPRCVHTIDELTLYSYKKDSLTDQILPQLQDKENHVIDALRYACEGVRKARKTVDKPKIIRHGSAMGWLG